MFRRAALVAACLIVAFVAAMPVGADTAGPPLIVPTGWQPVFDRTQGRVLVWKSADQSGYPSGFDLSYTIGGGRDALPDQAPQISDRCGTRVEQKRDVSSGSPAATIVRETLRYTLDDVPFLATYIYPDDKRDAVIERMMNAVCPADLPFIEPPAGWEHSPESGEAGLNAEFAPQLPPGSTNAGASLRVTAVGSSGDSPAASDFAVAARDAGLVAKPPAFHRVAARPACGVPLYLAQGVKNDDGVTLNVRLALSKARGRLYVAMLVDASVQPNAGQLAAIGSLCAERPFPMRWLLAPAPSPAPSPSPSP